MSRAPYKETVDCGHCAGKGETPIEVYDSKRSKPIVVGRNVCIFCQGTGKVIISGGRD